MSTKKLQSVSITRIAPAVLKQLAALLQPAAPVIAEPADVERFTKVSADGKLLPKSAKDWEGVYEAAAGLVWARRLLPGAANWKDSMAKANAATLCGLPARAPTVRERFCLSDFARLSPALDTDYFDPSEKDQWEWTSTESPSDCAWGVNLGYGYAGRFSQGLHGRVRAVRAGQFFDLSARTSHAKVRA